MKLHTEKLHVEKSEHLVEKEFSIKSTAKAFSILSGALYSDKPLAIVRELSCNAWDAHVAAKRTDVPFIIKLPTTLDPTFYVKDFGIGLSHDDVMQLYTTYFDSTKDTSDDFIGALGLGSKSPFSYVSTFSVESRFNGMKSLYTAFINETGVPAITLIGTEATDEGNGMTVSLATKMGDQDKFRAAARKALMYFNPQPKILGVDTYFKPYTLEHAVSGTNWRVRKTEYYAHMDGAYVVQGFVAYPIDREILRQADIDDVAYKVLRLNIDFDVPLGAVEMAPSREALSYTKKTIDNLVKSVEIAASEMRASIQKEFDACKTLWDARVLDATYSDHDHNMHTLYTEFKRDTPFKYKGKEVASDFPLDLTKITSTQLAVLRNTSYMKRTKRAGQWDPTMGAKTFTIRVQPTLKVIVDDNRKFGAIVGDYAAAERAKSKAGDITILVLKGTSKTTYDQQEIDTLIKALGSPSYELTSALPFQAARTTSTYRARKNDEALKWTGFPKNGGYRRNQIRRVFSRLCWDGAKVDLYDKKATKLYVEIDRFTILRKGKEVLTPFDIYLEAMTNVGIYNDTAIYGLTEKQLRLVKANKTWKSVFEYCEERLATMNANNELSDRITINSLGVRIGDGMMKDIVIGWDKTRAKVVDGEFKKTIDEVHAIYTNATTRIGYDRVRAALSIGAKDALAKADKRAVDAYDTFMKTMEKHAMLKFVNWSYVSSKDVSTIIDYVNFVEKGK